MKILCGFPVTTALLLSGCSGTPVLNNSESPVTQMISVDQLLASPDAFNNRTVRLDACLFVTIHGMSLFNCRYRRGEDAQLISFDPLDSERDKAYQRVVSAGFDSFSKYMVKVTLTGKFQFSPGQLPRYTFLVGGAENFRKIKDQP